MPSKVGAGSRPMTNHRRRTRGIHAIHSKAAQNPAHLAHKTGRMTPGLASVIEAWPTPSEPIEAGILAMVRAAGGVG